MPSADVKSTLYHDRSRNELSEQRESVFSSDTHDSSVAMPVLFDDHVHAAEHDVMHPSQH